MPVKTSDALSGRGGMLIGSLPMYDWPQVRHETDAYWQALRYVLVEQGFDVDAALNRHNTPLDTWLSPNLILSQTCGLPYVTTLKRHVALWGTPEYAVAGFYRSRYASQVVTRRGDSRSRLPEFIGTRFAYNSADSQSGFNAMTMLLTDTGIAESLACFDTKASGSHLKSLEAVAAADCDICCVDPVSWQLAQDHLPALTDSLQVIGETPATAALPLVYHIDYASDERIIETRLQLTLCIRRLSDDIKHALHIVDLHHTTPADYAGIAQSLTG